MSETLRTSCRNSSRAMANAALTFGMAPALWSLTATTLTPEQLQALASQMRTRFEAGHRETDLKACELNGGVRHLSVHVRRGHVQVGRSFICSNTARPNRL